jgi:Cu/Ag efflux protein CusF
MNDKNSVRPAQLIAQLFSPVLSLSRTAAPRALLLACAVGAVASLSPVPALADTASAQKVVRATGKPGKLESVSIQTTATVEKVDSKARKITLKTEAGSLLTLDVGPEVQRLDEIKKGDLLEVEYLESIGVAVQHPGDKDESADGAYSVLVRNPSHSPSGKLIDTETVSATVESVDVEKRVVELLRADGSRVKIQVSPEVQRLNEVKKGDTVTVKYTRSVALSVHKPTPK